MADARTEILARIGTALNGRSAPPPVPRHYRTSRQYPSLVELAAERIADYRANVHRCTAVELPAKIAGLVADRHTMIAPAGIPEEWRTGGVRWLAEPLSVPELDRAGGVLTGCALVIAETGTIVLDAGPDQGRRALTLVPDYHLCVVRGEQIVGTVPEAVARLEPTRPVTLVSGPSATSDIEFNRVEGVHGPRTLDVVIVT
jgi:L-lactate dehydrogenase complex protein LldG